MGKISEQPSLGTRQDTAEVELIYSGTNYRQTVSVLFTGYAPSSGTNTGDQNVFSTVAVAGQSNVVADSTSDTLTLAAGTGITLTTDASTDTVTITNSATGANAFGTFSVSGQSDVVAD